MEGRRFEPGHGERISVLIFIICLAGLFHEIIYGNCICVLTNGINRFNLKTWLYINKFIIVLNFVQILIVWVALSNLLDGPQIPPEFWMTKSQLRPVHLDHGLLMKEENAQFAVFDDPEELMGWKLKQWSYRPHYIGVVAYLVIGIISFVIRWPINYFIWKVREYVKSMLQMRKDYPGTIPTVEQQQLAWTNINYC